MKKPFSGKMLGIVLGFVAGWIIGISTWINSAMFIIVMVTTVILGAYIGGLVDRFTIGGILALFLGVLARSLALFLGMLVRSVSRCKMKKVSIGILPGVLLGAITGLMLAFSVWVGSGCLECVGILFYGAGFGALVGAVIGGVSGWRKNKIPEDTPED